MAYYAKLHGNSQLVLLDSNAFGPKAVLKCSKMIEAFLGSVGNWFNWQLQTGKPICYGWRPARCFKNGRNLRKQTCTPCWIDKYLLYVCMYIYNIRICKHASHKNLTETFFCVSFWVWAQFVSAPWDWSSLAVISKSRFWSVWGVGHGDHPEKCRQLRYIIEMSDMIHNVS